MIRIFKETITAFKRINRFSIYQYQNQKDKGPEILVYLVALTKNFDKIFLAMQILDPPPLILGKNLIDPHR